MKKSITIVALVLTISIQAQDYRKIVPFKYQNKWGIVDSLNNEVVKPVYKKVNVFDNFMFAEFDGKDLYNLKTGKKQKALGKFIHTFKIQGKNYHLFTNAKNSLLVNFEEKDTVKLAEKYTRIKTVQLYDLKNKESNVLVAGFLDYGKMKLLNNDKYLTPIAARKFSSEDVETIVNNGYKAFGFVYIEKGYYLFYNDKFEIIKKIKIPSDISKGYYLLTDKVRADLPTIYKTENAIVGYFSSESIWDNSWDLSTFLDDTPSESSYYIVKEKREYFLKNSADATLSLEILSNLFSYKNPYEMIRILSTSSSFFCDERYIRKSRILFPKKYLK